MRVFQRRANAAILGCGYGEALPLKETSVALKY